MSAKRLDGDPGRLLHFIRLEIGENLPGGLPSTHVEKHALRKWGWQIPDTRKRIKALVADGYLKPVRSASRSDVVTHIALTQAGIEHEDGSFDQQYNRFRKMSRKGLREAQREAFFAVTHFAEDSNAYRDGLWAKERIAEEMERRRHRRAVLIPTLVAAIAAVPAIEYIITGIRRLWEWIFG